MQKRYLIIYYSDSYLHFQRGLKRLQWFDHIYVFGEFDAIKNQKIFELFSSYSKLTFIPKSLSITEFIYYNINQSDEVVLPEDDKTQSEARDFYLEFAKVLKNTFNKTAKSEEPSASRDFILLTAANESYLPWLKQLLSSLAPLNYPIDIYDLGGLGVGIPYRHPRPLGQDGVYVVVDGIWKSRALHKPAIILDSLARNQAFTLYLDGDIHVLGALDGVVGDYDIGVTIRSDVEVQRERSKETFRFTGYINAGVVFVNNTEAAIEFIREWKIACENMNNDQLALNYLINPNLAELKSDIEIMRGNCKIRFFPGAIYNFDYQIGSSLNQGQKILHFKNNWERFEDYVRSKDEAIETMTLPLRLDLMKVFDFKPVTEQYPEAGGLWTRILASYHSVYELGLREGTEAECVNRDVILAEKIKKEKIRLASKYPRYRNFKELEIRFIQMQNTWSWRLTAPFRKIVSFLRRQWR